MATFTPDEDQVIQKGLNNGLAHAEIGKQIGRSTSSISGRVTRLKQATSDKANEVEVKACDSGMIATLRTTTVRTLDDLLETAEVNTQDWEVERWVANKWDVVAKCNVSLEKGGKFPGHELKASELWQVKAWFKRLTPEKRSIETLLQKMADRSVVVPKMKRKKLAGRPHRRELEISIVDPHLGLHCFKPASDKSWSIGQCEQMVLEMVERLILAAKPYAPFERIILPLGNDFMHADNIWHTTTQGTGQPEMESWHHVYERAELLGIAMLDRILKEAPVKFLTVPGNHDRQSAYTLGRVWQAYYRGDANVEADCSASPYKFHHFGTNLIGYEHGHSVAQIRLAALMANECRDIWGQTSYREWHIGDQHRKGSAKPCTLEEQGVSVEYLPGLTPPNEWHRLKSYNWQKRAGMGFIWDHDEGPLARLQVNVDSYTGKIMGEG